MLHWHAPRRIIRFCLAAGVYGDGETLQRHNEGLGDWPGAVWRLHVVGVVVVVVEQHYILCIILLLAEGAYACRSRLGNLLTLEHFSALASVK